MATPQPPKTMSSRLMNMKFMQRSGPPSPATADTPEKPSKKRKKLDDGSAQAMEEASKASYNALVAAEDAQRQKALEKQAEAAGDTKWVLDTPAAPMPAAGKNVFTIVNASYGGIDTYAATGGADDVGEDDTDYTNPSIGGRKSFGKFNKQIERQAKHDANVSEDEKDENEDTDEDEEDSEDSDASEDEESNVEGQRHSSGKGVVSEATERLRASREEKRRAEGRAIREKSVKRKSSQINLNRRSDDDDLRGLTSISGGGGTPSVKAKKEIICYSCNRSGHVGRDCPFTTRKRGGRR